MNREVHVRIWERPEVRVLWATRQFREHMLTESFTVPDTQRTSATRSVHVANGEKRALSSSHQTEAFAPIATVPAELIEVCLI